jgi:2-oxoglutarate dehydrogenase E2 component (dihydrolipoamide succinyltransferase)
MAVDVLMPQMGESVAEGTVVRWIKKVGDAVDRDEPLCEISTDKVDAEIPSPATGVVTEIRAKEGETVPVNSVVAVIGPSEAVSPAAPAPIQPSSAAPAAPAPSRPQPVAVHPPPPLPVDTGAQAAPARALPVGEDVLRQKSSPLVRKIAKEHHVELSKIPGSGIAGRVTKHDILEYLEREARLEQAGREEQRERVGQDRVEKMSVMRRKIAEHMIESRRTSAHVHSVFEVNFSRVAQVRDSRKVEFEQAGAKLTYLTFIVKAVVNALRAVPVVNSSVEGDTIVFHKDINIGIAVALDWGLIVPVIKQADERNLLGLSRAIADLATRARARQLKPDEVTGGTFTITNPGVFGALFGMPIINQPQVAILGVGAVEKRPVVIDDAIAIRPMAYLSLGYDHRIIDGAVADEFMSQVKRALENWDVSEA